jgi:hypothetical protein
MFPLEEQRLTRRHCKELTDTGISKDASLRERHTQILL